MMHKLFFAILMIFVSIIIFGCTAHRTELAGLERSIPHSFPHAYPTSLESHEMGRWWEAFHDSRLDALIDEAFKHNPGLDQAYARLEQVKAATALNSAALKPSLTFNASAGRSRFGGFSVSSGLSGGAAGSGFSGFSGGITEDRFTLSARAGYEIDVWKKLRYATHASLLDEKATEYDIRALYISLSAELADLYYLAVEQRAQLDLSDQIIRSFKDTLEIVEHRYNEGLVPALDVYQSRQNLAATKARRPLFEKNLDITLNAISILLGRFPEKEIAGYKAMLPEAPVFYAGIPSTVLKQRPDVEASLLNLRASDERVSAAIADRFPSFNLTGSYGGESDILRRVLDSPNIFWNIAAEIAQPILDGGRRKAEVKRAESVVKEYLARYLETMLRAFVEVEDALVKGAASEKRIDLLKEQVSAAKDSLRLSLNRYLQGLSDYLPVLTAQQRYYDAKSLLISAKRQIVSDRIQLARSLGGNWTDQYVSQRMEQNKERIDHHE